MAKCLVKKRRAVTIWGSLRLKIRQIENLPNPPAIAAFRAQGARSMSKIRVPCRALGL